MSQWLPGYEEPTNLLVLASEGVEEESSIVAWWPLETKFQYNIDVYQQ